MGRIDGKEERRRNWTRRSKKCRKRGGGFTKIGGKQPALKRWNKSVPGNDAIQPESDSQGRFKTSFQTSHSTSPI